MRAQPAKKERNNAEGKELEVFWYINKTKRGSAWGKNKYEKGKRSPQGEKIPIGSSLEAEIAT